MRFAILGAGGVGGFFGGLLARSGFEVAFLARGPHLAAIRSRGLEVRAPEESFTVFVEAAADAEDLGHPEFAIVAVKAYSLEAILPAARLLAGRGATLVPLLNGVDAADRLIAGGVPKENVIGGLTHVSAARIAPGVVERKSALRRVVVGELPRGVSVRAETLAAVLREAGAEATVSPDITADLWRKLAFIASIAAACGLARSPLGPVRDTPLGKLLFARAVREVFAVARARGVPISDDDEGITLTFIDSLGSGTKPSFLLDLEAGGPTEIDDLCGAVSRLGREAGVETPIHDTATATLSVRRMPA